MLFTSQKEICVNDIAKEFTLSRPTISHHLLLMKRAGFLKSRRQGNQIYYSFNKALVTKQLQSVLESLKTCC